MGEPAQIRKLTVDEYLDLEKRSDVRHEFVAGLIFAMNGESRANNTIAGNLYVALRNFLRGGGCRTYINSVKVRIAHLDTFYYPDVVVSCDPRDQDRYVVAHPDLIIEVLSPTTEGVDRREKRFNYTQIASLQEYVLVSQDARRVEVLRRGADWLPEVVEDAGVVELRSIGLKLPIEAIYEDIVT